jgi:hypothetical protein
MLKTMNGAPIDIANDRRWYQRVCDRFGIEMKGGHFLLVPEGFEPDSNTWTLLHGESMESLNDFGLDDGDTVEDLAEYLRECMPGALVAPPTIHGRVDVSIPNAESETLT